MFIMSVKLSQKKMLIGALVLVAAVSAGVLLSNHIKPDSGKISQTVPAIEDLNESKDTPSQPDKAVNKEKEKLQKKAAAKTNEQRIAFVESFGWEIDSEPAEIIEVIIPKEFDEIYSEYNSIQKMQGFDLSSFSGKRCKRYSYTVLNYPGQTENIRVNLIVYNNKIVGGDVSSLDMNGFMHGFQAE